MMYKPTIVFDFDGVIHSYTSGWKGAENIPDPPVRGIKRVIYELQDRDYYVVICTTRANTEAGAEAVRAWLREYGFPDLTVTDRKPPASVYVDDRAICFDGSPSTLIEQITGFETWQQKIMEGMTHESIDG